MFHKIVQHFFSGGVLPSAAFPLLLSSALMVPGAVLVVAAASLCADGSSGAIVMECSEVTAAASARRDGEPDAEAEAAAVESGV